MKLENKISKAIFLAPKVYCYLTEDNKFEYRVKGLSKDSSLTFNDFKELLTKNSILESNQSKWFKSFNSADITIKDQIYSCKVTSNKRELVYENNIFVTTNPLDITDKDI